MSNSDKQGEKEKNRPSTMRNPRAKTKQGKNTKAHVKVASLNIRGRAATISNPCGKWKEINDLLKRWKIGILAVQEAHLTQDVVDSLHNMYGKRFEIFHSQGDSASAAGIAFVINLDLLTTKGATHHEIVPGRASLLTIQWHSDLIMSILNVYGFNDSPRNGDLWDKVGKTITEKNLPTPDIMLGDFNVVEDAVDRFPSHEERLTYGRDRLIELRNSLNLKDGWRTTYPNDKRFTFGQNSERGSRSRIDRIYTTDVITLTATDWEIDPTAIQTDHDMVSVCITSPEAPYVGKGRWAMNERILRKKEFRNYAVQRTLELGKEIENITEQNRTSEHNPQRLFKTYKDETADFAKKLERKLGCANLKHMLALKKEAEDILANEEMPLEDRLKESEARYQRVKDIERRQYRARLTATKAKYKKLGEKVGGFWSNLNKAKKPKDPIYSLKKPSAHRDPEMQEPNEPVANLPPQYEKRSDRMAELARDAHEVLLTEGIHPDEEERQRITNEILKDIPEERKLPEYEKDEILGSEITEEDVDNALTHSANGSSPGINGLPYEYWKYLRSTRPKKKDEAERETEDEDHNIVKILTEVYRDIEKHGIEPSTGFTEGWMCPLYKKGDRREISNYRPITLLNSDYKIFTKALSVKLAQVAGLMIHPDQAGFMPGRSITDQVMLAKMMIHYAEATEENGMLVTLDQEKAYDKVRHDYLWKTLETFGLPERFINTVKALYDSAETIVIINGEKSSPFRVSRGVRQGDPLSCLLFDIAIEPLANMLRNSPNLQGYKIPGRTEKLITSLFADDTSAYLSRNDKYEDLVEICDKWCIASGARFNMDKTIIIPMGTKKHRKYLKQHRRSKRSHEKIKTTVKMADEKDPTRLLGAWIGNGIDGEAVWSTNMDKITNGLERWGKSNPSMFGRRLIVQMVAGGISQYMTTVQGMPPHVETRLEKTISKFIWNDKKPMINKQQLSAPIGKGGLGLLDIRARNEAIDLMHLKNYLNLSENRPVWALVLDVLMENSLTKSSKVDKELTINSYLQDWSPTLRKNSHLPEEIKRMIKTGNKYNVSFSTLHIPENVKRKLPVWYHLGTENYPKGFNNRMATHCVKWSHQARTVGDLLKITQRVRYNTPEDFHQDIQECECTKCTDDREDGCENPNDCCGAAITMLECLKPKWSPLVTQWNNDGLSLTPERKKANASAMEEKDGEITFNPTVRREDNLNLYFRIFTDPTKASEELALRIPPQRAQPGPERTVYTDGSCQILDDGTIGTGSGIWFGNDEDEGNASLRIKYMTQSNQIGELCAVLWAIHPEMTPLDVTLRIKSDSKYVIDGLTKHLSKWESIGYIGIANKELFKALAAALRCRSAPTTLQWVKGHSGVEGNEKADELADEGAKDPNFAELDLSIPARFDLTGAELAAVTQSLAYKGICEQKRLEQKEKTLTILELTREAVREAFGIVPSNQAIWNAIRNKDLPKTFQVFLFKTIHNAHKIGRWWLNIQGYEERAMCAKCENIEDLHHIMISCDILGAKLVWDLAKEIWERRHPNKWPEINDIGSIIRCTMAEFKTSEGASLPGNNRLFKTLISEATQLIWDLRNNRVCNEIAETDWPTETIIKAKWRYRINERFKLDRASTNKKLGPAATDRSVILKTWSGVIFDELAHDIDWIDERGVVVVPGPQEHSRQDGDLPDPP